MKESNMLKTSSRVLAWMSGGGSRAGDAPALALGGTLPPARARGPQAVRVRVRVRVRLPPARARGLGLGITPCQSTRASGSCRRGDGVHTSDDTCHSTIQPMTHTAQCMQQHVTRCRCCCCCTTTFCCSNRRFGDAAYLFCALGSRCCRCCRRCSW